MKAGLLMYRVLVADNYPIIRMAVKNLVVDYRMKLATQLVVNKKRHSA
ncbi:hypothetical protein LMB65_04640 [Limosilactobacillus reuteri]|nr:hypothetical protein [Limosilactobacillus reuteri]